MSKSARICSADLRKLFKLIGECRDLGDDPGQWRRHWYAKVATLIGADLCLGGELTGLAEGRPQAIGMAEWGWENGFNRAGWLRSLDLMRTDPNYTLLFSAYGQRFRSQKGIALSVTDLLDDKTWLRSTEYQEVYRVMGVNHHLWCAQVIPGTKEETNGEFFCRAEGRRDFNAREKGVLGEAHALLGPLVSGALARYTEPAPSDLSPRVREVLRCLLEGDGDKQIAARLRISPYTVNVHTKAIFRHFSVRSRAELLARWIRRGWSSRCVWADREE
jgi:DNA-binding CsgD family transcriptional regulator